MNDINSIIKIEKTSEGGIKNTIIFANMSFCFLSIIKESNFVNIRYKYQILS